MYNVICIFSGIVRKFSKEEKWLRNTSKCSPSLAIREIQLNKILTSFPFIWGGKKGTDLQMRSQGADLKNIYSSMSLTGAVQLVGSQNFISWIQCLGWYAITYLNNMPGFLSVVLLKNRKMNQEWSEPAMFIFI